VRRVTAPIRREMRPRAAVEPVIGQRHQGRAPDGPQLSQRARRRLHQCCARHCRLQFRFSPALARAAFARLDADAPSLSQRQPKTPKERSSSVLHGRLALPAGKWGALTS
jgi:hypothetical protein